MTHDPHIAQRKLSLLEELNTAAANKHPPDTLVDDKTRKSIIRDLVIECLICQLSDDELKEAKRTIIAQMECTPRVVDGIHAQLTKELTAAFGDYPMLPEAVSAVLTIGRRLENTEKKSFENLVIKELAPKSGLAEKDLEVISSKFRKLAGNRIERVSHVLQDLQTDEVTGESVSYHNPTKRRWRSMVESELRSYLSMFSPSQIADMKVLCLPSANPGPELSIYLRAGLNPENIYAVEGGTRETRARFLENIRSLGGVYQKVNCITQKLENWLPQINERMRFDVICLDFHGQFSFKANNALSNTPVADHAFVMTNLMARRETELGSYGIRMRSIIEEQGVDYFSIPGRENRSIDSTSLADARVQGLDLCVLDSIGSGVIDATPRVERITQDLYPMINDKYWHENEFGYEQLSLGAYSRFLQKEFVEVATAMTAGLTVSYGNQAINRDNVALLVSRWAAVATFSAAGFAIPAVIKRYEYKSESGTGKTPFYTTIGQLKRPRKLYEAIDNFTCFMMHSVAFKLFNGDISLHMVALDRKLEPLINNFKKPHRKDKLSIAQAPDDRRARIPVLSLLKVVGAAESTFNELGLINIETFPSNGRILVP